MTISGAIVHPSWIFRHYESEHVILELWPLTSPSFMYMCAGVFVRMHLADVLWHSSPEIYDNFWDDVMVLRLICENHYRLQVFLLRKICLDMVYRIFYV